MKKPLRIGVVADDITGANDIGLCFQKAGATVIIYTFRPDLAIDTTADVVIIDTDSRFNSPADSYDKVYQATQLLQQEAGIQRFFKKTCSVFRGNVGYEFDAMLDALNASQMHVIAGFPDNGRTTICGTHYVNGIPLEKSQFANDPIHPMSLSKVKDILSLQTKRDISNLTYPSYQSQELLEQTVRAQTASYLVYDVRSNQDLEKISDVIAPSPVYGGSSAIGEYLPISLKLSPQPAITPPCRSYKTGVLVLVGSLTPQTLEQTAYAKAHYPSYELNTRRVLQGDTAHLTELATALSERIARGEHCILHTEQSSNTAKETKHYRNTLKLSAKQVGQSLSAALAQIATTVLQSTSSRRFLSLGGDTSAAIAQALQITAMFVVDEIVVGVPTLLQQGGQEYFFVLKSGSFGEKDFIPRAIKKLTPGHLEE